MEVVSPPQNTVYLGSITNLSLDNNKQVKYFKKLWHILLHQIHEIN